ncbi:MAG TPA: alpha/beta fold hydrolase, partial [Myxococcota bacterium]|nr:alpha/beta fold hydrolase [Myxococcota bacterium]
MARTYRVGASRWRARAAPATLARMLAPLRRRRLALPGSALEIALLDWGGDGPLALLHHANGFCAAVWGPVAERLRGRFHVVAMDARGHGDSSKPAAPDAYCWERFARDAIEVAERLAGERGDGRVALAIGHSLGGSALALAAAERPDLFERLALVDPVLIAGRESASAAERGVGRGLPDPRRLEGIDGTELAENARKRREIWPSRAAARAKWLDKSMFAEWDSRALELYLAEGLADRADGQVELKCTAAVEAAVFEATGSFDLWSCEGRLRAPTLIERAARGVFS